MSSKPTNLEVIYIFQRIVEADHQELVKSVKTIFDFLAAILEDNCELIFVFCRRRRFTRNLHSKIVEVFSIDGVNPIPRKTNLDIPVEFP